MLTNPGPSKKRRLVALMFTDIVGYSALSSRDEKLALRLLDEHRAIFRRIFPNHGGHENKTIGDAFFIEFGSAVEALQCAIEIQTALYERNAFATDGKRIQVRIGLHLGDVIEHDGDTYGDGVNIAARVETLAPSGGICMTRQVLDQVAGKFEIPFRRIGRIELKNISAPTDIYRVVLPWEKRSRDSIRDLLRAWGRTLFSAFRKGAPVAIQNRLEKVRAALAAAQTLVIWFVAAATLGMTLHGLRPDRSDRAPASSSRTSERVSLETGWSWKTAQDGSAAWRPFDPKNPWKSADDLSGEYWLRREFETSRDSPFSHPAIVLGPIARSHHAYLNGRFIGGSGLFTAIEYYPFDPSLLKPAGERNELLVRANGPPSLNPGLNVIPEVGAFLGEFDDVYRAASSDRFRHHVVRSVFLAMTLLISAASLAFYLWHRDRRKFLYLSLYLMLGALALSYHNAFVAHALDFRHYRFLKVFSVSLSSFMLLSAYLAQKKLRALELLNNVAALAVALAIAALTLFPGSSGVSPSLFIDRYNGVLAVSLAYTLTWVAMVCRSLGVRAWAEFRERKRRAEATASFRRHDSTIAAFGVLAAGLLYSSLMSEAGHLPLLNSSRSGIQRIGMLGPVLFALYLLIAGIRDYVAKSRKVIYKKRRDDLILNVIRAASECTSKEEALSRIQEQVSVFVRAERSALYLFDEKKQLRAAHVFGEAAARQAIASEPLPLDGVIGYVLESRSPLLIHDIRTDLRFAQHLQSRGGPSSFRTGSCMIFPLTAWGQIHGVLTLADHRSGQFTREDFALLHVISKNLALIVANAQLERRLNVG